MKPEKIKKVLKLDESEVVEEVSEKSRKKALPSTYLYQATEIGFTIALPISMGALFGLWLDKKFASAPKLTLTFLFIGIFIAFANLFVIVRKFSQK